MQIAQSVEHEILDLRVVGLSHMLVAKCSRINKNSEINIAVKVAKQKNK